MWWIICNFPKVSTQFDLTSPHSSPLATFRIRACAFWWETRGSLWYPLILLDVFISYLSSKIRFNMPRHHQGLSSSSDVTCSEMLCFNHLADHGDVVTYGNTWAGLGFQRIELPVCECIGWAWQDEMICRRCIIVSRIIFQSWALEQTFWWTYVVYRITQRACRKSLVLLHLRCASRLLHLYWVHWDRTGTA